MRTKLEAVSSVVSLSVDTLLTSPSEEDDEELKKLLSMPVVPGDSGRKLVLGLEADFTLKYRDATALRAMRLLGVFPGVVGATPAAAALSILRAVLSFEPEAFSVGGRYGKMFSAFSVETAAWGSLSFGWFVADVVLVVSFRGKAEVLDVAAVFTSLAAMVRRRFGSFRGSGRPLIAKASLCRRMLWFPRVLNEDGASHRPFATMVDVVDAQ